MFVIFFWSRDNRSSNEAFSPRCLAASTSILFAAKIRSTFASKAFAMRQSAKFLSSALSLPIS
jgi:hypothetical protein